MAHVRFTRSAFAPALVALAAVSCLKATKAPGSDTSGGGATPIGTAGNGNPQPGGGGASGGGQVNPGGGMTSSMAGSGVVIIDPSGGSAGAPAATKMACMDSPNQKGALPYTSGYTISDAAKSQAASIVQSMTVTQKANQLRGPGTSGYSDIFRTADDSSIGVKGFQFADGPRGVNLDAVKSEGSQGYSTVFPAASLRGATFDTDLENQVGAAMGDELIASGRTMLLAPTVNILRHPAWGRSEETYGEDSFMLGRLGSAFVQGVQTYAPACVKHYAANNIEKNRETDVAQMDEQTLQEIYAHHFGMIIRDGGVSCVMAAYNLVQVPPGEALNCTQNKHLLTDILRTEFGFKGMVLSDWWAMPGGQMGSMQSTKAAQGIKAGMDMELPWNLNYSTLETITGSSIDASDLTNSALRVVTEKYRFGVASLNGSLGLKKPTTTFNSGSYSIGNNDAHIALAQKTAQEGMVLLKNENKTLPIKADGTVKTVAVVGLKVGWMLMGSMSSGSVDFPQDARIGDLGSSRVNMDPGKAIGPFAGIKAAAPMGVNVVMDDSGGTSVAQGADFVVVVAGLTPEDEGEDYTIKPEDSDRGGSLALDGKHGGMTQNKYIQTIAALGKPTVVVLEGGSVIDVSSFISSVPALVMAWYPGQAGGAALGSLLFGKANFSGKLPVTWPKSLADEPPFSGGASNTTMMSYYLGYRWFDNQKKTPQFPFGHGLSYSTFEYSNLQVPCSTVTKGGVVSVSVDVKNTSAVDGDETVFLFASWPSSTVATRANGYRELKGFARASVPAGKTARVTIPIRISDLEYYNVATKAWAVETGPVQVMVGGSSAALPLMDTFMVQ